MKFTKDYLSKNSPNINFMLPEATYLLWLNFKSTTLQHEEIKKKLLTQSKVALNDGVSFGSNGESYFRINVALRKNALEVALEDISKSF
jgi:cystathionine beta-lyase